MMSCNPSSPWLLSTLFWFTLLAASSHGDPTDGFTEVPLPEKDFDIQKPYNVPVNERYTFNNGIRQLWVYSDDNPFQPDSDTKPRSEIRMRGYDYSDGTWQFEGYGYVPSGTTGVSIMQILHASDGHATSFMAHVYDGQLTYYHDIGRVIEDDIYDRWFRLNVIHAVGQNITVFVDAVQKLVVPDRGGTDHYFKFGVYTQNDSSDCMESRWKNVKIFNKS